MIILTPKNWAEYQLLDSGNGKRLERFGKYLLVRPDPQCLWKPLLPASEWQKADAIFQPEGREKGKWVFTQKLPNHWQIGYQDIKLVLKFSPFKHTGVFPEQAAHWEFLRKTIEDRKLKVGVEDSGLKIDKKQIQTDPSSNAKHQAPLIINSQNTTLHHPSSTVKVLNLFGYTGAASLAAAAAGAEVTHVDASYPTIGWARENQKASGLEQKPIRWILDDCLKFVEREVRRGNKYEGIIMDPPVYGHGPKGEKWDFNTSFPKLLELCIKLLSDKKMFLIINAYAVSASSVMLENMLKDTFKEGTIESGELVLEETSGRQLSTGIFARWKN